MKTKAVRLLLAATLVSSCATLRDVIRAPEFSVASGRQAELRLVGPSRNSPTGGAALRVWARVHNPNALGMTVAGLQGSLFLENTRAAAVDFPLGMPLQANQDTIIPIDISIRWSDLPGLADLASRLLSRSAIPYRLDGTVTVDAGLLGRPSFGPNTLLRGEVPIRR